MSKFLKFMMAIALSTAAGSAMASTINPSSGIIDLNPGDSINFWGGATPSTSYNDVWTINIGGAVNSVVGTIAASVALGDPTKNQISGMSLTDGVSTWAALFDSVSRNWIIQAALLGGHTYSLDVWGKGGYTANISAVPLPAAGLLFGTALLGAAGLGRKKRETVQADAVAA